MDHERAEENLEIIRTLMERGTRYEYLSARGRLQVGAVAVAGALAFLRLDPASPVAFGGVWGAVFATSLAVMVREQVAEVRLAGVPLWTRAAREIVRALLPAMAMAAVLTAQAFAHGRHLELPGIWMLCYGCGALATATFAPPAVFAMGVASLILGAVTLWLGPAWSTVMMGLVFGVGHLVLAACLFPGAALPLRPITQAEV